MLRPIAQRRFWGQLVAQGEEDVAPSVIRATVNVARLILPAALAREEHESNHSGQHSTKGEEHTQQREEVLLRMRQVLEEQRSVCWHGAPGSSAGGGRGSLPNGRAHQ
ncbi:hypothetical protein A1Q2_07648 [Trichosporon asahii var. asahii CBS 8904]|uniref:Uncharacterized protein n=1 Tax=Trichosporon asahii var. asahii (strain CBS 8904) TaxID=1220162 RepID=K1VN45_TRIAC|nr:hypothetical protein A1Q2_07648 [Trichosporon asahii var. asahii CBS 8904]